MKVLLILPKVNSDCQWNVGLSYISAVLKKNGHSVELREVRNYPKDVAGILEKIAHYDPGVIGISANSHQFKYAKLITAEIKKDFKIPVFIGGVHTILQPSAIEEIKELDGVCLGEGEWPFLSLVDKLAAGDSYLNINNFWFRDGEQIIKNERAPLIEDLNVLPYPDRSIFEYFQEKKEPAVPRFIFSRGCPFECAYCCNHAFKRIYGSLGRYVRWQSVDRALAEIELVRQDYNFVHFKLDDDIFSLNKEWLKEFCEKITAKKWGLTFECNVRPGTIDEEGLGFLKMAGCQMIKIGIETGDENLRQNILNRHFSNEDIVKTFALAKQFGIKTFSFNIIGVPNETPATVKKTIELNRRIRPDFMQVTAFYPYAGTVLGQRCLAENYIAEAGEDSYMEKTILKLPTISKRQIERSVRNFKFNVYWAYNKKKALKEKLVQIKETIIRQPIIHYLAKKLYRSIKKLARVGQ